MIEYTRRAAVYAKNDRNDSDNENWWQRRSGFEKKLMISCIIVSVFLIGCLLYIALKQTPIQEVCSTPICLSSASELTSHMDPEADPCEDFFQFVCGKFTESTHESLKLAYAEQLQDTVQSQLAELIEEPISEDDHYLVRTQKELYQACLQQTGAEESVDIFQATLLDELGGWPVVKNFRWKAKWFTWVETIQLLRSKGYPHSMLLSVWVSFSVDNPEDNIVTITNPHVEVIEDEYKQAYLNYMIDVADIFGAERHRAEIEMREVLEFIEELHQIEEVYLTNHTDSQLSNKVTIKEYQERYEEIEWLEFINSILYPHSNVTIDDYIKVFNDEYMKAYFNLLDKTFKRTKANYIIWRVLDQVIPYMSKELKQLKENYLCLTNQQPSSQDRSEFCRGIIDEHPFNILYARKYLPEEKRDQAQELLWSIKSEFMTILTETSWLDEESAAEAVEKLDGALEIVGASGDYLNDTIFEDLLGSSDDISDSTCNNTFFCLYLNTNKHLTDSYYALLDFSVNGTVVYDWIGHTELFYVGNANAIVLGAAFLRGNIYNEDRPMYLNYANAGAKIGSELFQGLFKAEAATWPEETINAVKEQLECIFIVGPEDLDMENIDNGTKAALIDKSSTDYIGLKNAYRAYKNWINDNGEETQLAGVEHTPIQLFWIYAMSLKCFNLNAEETVQNNTYRIFQLNGPFRNNPEFSNDFNCPLDSGMNPTDRCKIL